MTRFAKGNPGGPGRPRKAEKFEKQVARAEKVIADKLPDLLENMLRLAQGVSVQEVSKDGKEVVYMRPPDFKANEYLINRIMGKPTERQEISGPDGDDISITHSIAQAAAEILQQWRQQPEPLPNTPSTTLPVVLE